MPTRQGFEVDLTRVTERGTGRVRKEFQAELEAGFRLSSQKKARCAPVHLAFLLVDWPGPNGSVTGEYRPSAVVPPGQCGCESDLESAFAGRWVAKFPDGVLESDH